MGSYLKLCKLTEGASSNDCRKVWSSLLFFLIHGYSLLPQFREQPGSDNEEKYLIQEVPVLFQVTILYVESTC